MSRAARIIEAQAEADDDEQTYYHVTPARNVSKIMREGLHPRIGRRSKALGEKHPATYLYKTPGEAEEGVMNWLGDQFSEDTRLSMLKVHVPRDMPVEHEAFEHRVMQHIPAQHISVHKAGL